jgi:hypothetical protein
VTFVDKLCKRCQFRTPLARAICQVCGHAEFVKLDQSAKCIDATKRELTTLVDGLLTPPNDSTPAQQKADLACFAEAMSWAKSICRGTLCEVRELGEKLRSAAGKTFLLLVTPASEDPLTHAKTPVNFQYASATALSDHAVSKTRNASQATLVVAPPPSQPPLLPLENVGFMELSDRKEHLNQLLCWFQSYGRDQQILVQGNTAELTHDVLPAAQERQAA